MVAGASTRVGVDGPVEADAAALADLVATALRGHGRSVLRVRCGDFLRPRSVRLETGADDPDAGYERWYDAAGLRREVLDPLGPDGTGQVAATLWDAVRDRATREPRRPVAPGTLAVVDGPFLLRWELADAFDAVVHLDLSPAARRRRLPEAERARVDGAWQRYLDETWPASRATYVVRHDHPARPALVLPDSG